MKSTHFFGKNRRSYKAHRTGRRGIRRRLFIFGIPLLLISIFVGGYVFQVNAANNSVYTHFYVDVDRADFEHMQSIVDKYTSRVSRTNVIGALYSDINDIYAGVSYYPSATAFAYEFSNGKVESSSMQVAPGKYYFSYKIVSSAKCDYYYSSNSACITKDDYYDSYSPDDYTFDMDDGILKMHGVYSTNVIPVTVLGNGMMVDANGNEVTVKLSPHDYSKNPLSVDVYLRSYKNNDVPSGRILKAKLYHGGGGWSENNNIQEVASATMPITKTGFNTITFKNANISHPTSELDARYCVSYWVEDNKGNIDNNWQRYDCVTGGSLERQYTRQSEKGSIRKANSYFQLRIAGSRLGIMSSQAYYPSYSGYRETTWSVNIGGTYDKYFIPFVIFNDYINVTDVLKNETPEVNNRTDGTNEFRAIRSTNDIKDGSKYLFVAKNNVDGKYYALSAGNNASAVLLSDFNDSNLQSYKVSDQAISNGNYVLTARDSDMDGAIADAKFISNVSSNTKRNLTLKLNSASLLEAGMFDGYGGTRVYIEKDNLHEGQFRVRRNYGGELILNDVFGHVSFIRTRYLRYLDSENNNKYRVTLEFNPRRNNSNNEFYSIYSYRDGISLNYMTGICQSLSVVSTTEYGNCVLNSENKDFYNSEDYYSKVQQNLQQSIYILTNSELENSDQDKQNVTAAYYPIGNISDPDNYKTNYNKNFLLVYKDAKSVNHALSANNPIQAESREYYSGEGVTVNNNGSISTTIDNAFSFDEENDIKEETTNRLKLHGLKQLDESSKNPYLTIDSDDDGNYISYTKSRKEISFYFNNDNTLYVRASKSDRWIGWGEVTNKNGDKTEGFISVPSKDMAVKFAVYAPQYKNFELLVHEDVNDLDAFKSTIVSVRAEVPQSGSTVYRSNKTRMPYSLGSAKNIDGQTYLLAGWTLDRNKAGIVDEDFKNENIFDKKNGIKEEFVDEYRIISNTDYVDIATIVTDEEYTVTDPLRQYTITFSGKADIYPIYVKTSISKASLFSNFSNQSVIGMTDWKDEQNVSSTTSSDADYDERWQGSISLEVYVDGEIYGEPSKLYFQYHNDDAADVILKFINEDKLAAQTGGDADMKLQQYLLDDSILPAKSQYGDYVIDAVIAEQAGSEDGLKYVYNWVNESGARLDNVKGGSTIKVYMSNKYQVKYYLDDEELKDEDHTDTNYYASDATLKAIEAEEAVLNLNSDITDEQLKGLMDKNITTVGNSDVYKPADSKRFIFEAYKYVVHERNNKFTAAKAPTIPAGKKLKNAMWQIKDKNENVIAEISPEELAAISEQEGGVEKYFNALTQYAHKADNDEVNTFHLYLYTESESPVEEKNPTTDNSKDQKNPQRQNENPLTSAFGPAIYFIAFGALSSTFSLIVYKRTRQR